MAYSFRYFDTEDVKKQTPIVTETVTETVAKIKIEKVKEGVLHAVGTTIFHPNEKCLQCWR